MKQEKDDDEGETIRRPYRMLKRNKKEKKTIDLKSAFRIKEGVSTIFSTLLF